MQIHEYGLVFGAFSSFQLSNNPERFVFLGSQFWNGPEKSNNSWRFGRIGSNPIQRAEKHKLSLWDHNVVTSNVAQWKFFSRSENFGVTTFHCATFEVTTLWSQSEFIYFSARWIGFEPILPNLQELLLFSGPFQNCGPRKTNRSALLDSWKDEKW